MGNLNDCRFSGIAEKKQKRYERIEQQLEQYAIENKINLIPRSLRMLIQKYFIFGHKHISDRLIQLHRSKEQKEIEKLIEDLEQIDLEILDELHYLSVQSSKFKLKSTKQKQSLTQIKVRHISDDYSFRGRKLIENDKVIFIGFINCFNSFNVLLPSNLTSKKSPFQIFLEKIQGFKEKYNAPSHVYLICSQKQISKQLSNLIKNSSMDIKIILHKPVLPIINHEGQIKLYGNRLKFNAQMGDIIQFLFSCHEFKDKLQTISEIGYSEQTSHAEYVNFCDISNLCSELIDINVLGWLDSQKNKSCALTVRKNVETMPVKDGFIDVEQSQQGDCLIKVAYLQQAQDKNKNKYQILARSIHKQQIINYTDQFYFYRLPHNILFATQSSIIPQRFYGNQIITYSNFCKIILGIQNQEEEDYVEISPNIVHGPQSKIEDIRQNLVKNGNIGFPLLILKKHQE